MKNKKEFLSEFFDRLIEAGFMVEVADESDIAAEVYQNNTLFCVVTQDGDIIYEAYDEGKARELEQLIKQVHEQLNVCTSSPFAQAEPMETVSLVRGAYFKIMESINMVLLCRYSGIFGYEFVTCQKAQGDYNTRKYYREQVTYCEEEAQLNFAQRSNLTLKPVSLFTDDELRLVLSCLSRTICLDNNIDGSMEQEVKHLIAKAEQYLPTGQDFSPRHFFDREN